MSDAPLTPEQLEQLHSSMPPEELATTIGELTGDASVEELFSLVRDLVGRASDEQIAVLTGDLVLRSRLFDEVMARMAGQLRADKAKGLDAVVHWKIFDRPGGGYDHYELVISDGACRLSPYPRHDARVTFKIAPADFLRLITGHAGGVRLALTGRLRIAGDMAFATRVNALFELPDGD